MTREEFVEKFGDLKEIKIMDMAGLMAYEATQDKKLAGAYRIVKAFGAIELDGCVYEVQVVIEPKKENWAEDKEAPNYIKSE